MINILLDENLTFELIGFFERMQFKVYHVKKLGKTGIRNGDVYKLAKELDAWIITRDSDFESITKFDIHKPQGVIVLKVINTRTPALLALMKSVLDRQLIPFLHQHLIIIEEDNVSIIK